MENGTLKIVNFFIEPSFWNYHKILFWCAMGATTAFLWKIFFFRSKYFVPTQVTKFRRKCSWKLPNWSFRLNIFITSDDLALCLYFFKHHHLIILRWIVKGRLKALSTNSSRFRCSNCFSFKSKSHSTLLFHCPGSRRHNPPTQCWFALRKGRKRFRLGGTERKLII